MTAIRKYYVYLQLLSIDVVIGSMVMSWLFAYWLNSEMTPWYYFSFGSVVWLVYTMDHILDAKRIKGIASTPRHRFHQKHYKLLLNLWYLYFCVSLALSLYKLPQEIVVAGLVMIVFILVHFIIVKLFGEHVSVFVQKEISISLIYTSGICFGPIVCAPVSPDIQSMLMMAQVFVLALINLVEFSFFDKSSDEQDEHTSIVRLIGQKRSKNFIKILVGINILLITYGLLIGPTKFVLIELVILLMTTSLYLVIRQPSYFYRFERYRIIGDLIFVYPIILFAI